MHVRVAIPEHHVGPETLEPALESVTRVDEHLIRSGAVPLAREAIRAGVRWRPEPPGEESFDHSDIVWGRGWGDCDDLAPWHAASLRVTGEDPGAAAIIVPSGPQTWHAVVERSDGRIDDPSLAAGMPHPSGGGALPVETAMVVGAVYVGLRPTSTGWQARVDLPVVGCIACGCALSVLEADDTPQRAVSRAAQRAAVVGQLGGAMSHDVEKLNALAALANGISQRQLIEHVDPDLLLCAVLLNTTIERKLDEWHRRRGMIAGAPRGWARVAGVVGMTPAEARHAAAAFVKGQAHYWKTPKGRRYLAGRRAAAAFVKGQAHAFAKLEADRRKLLKHPRDDQATVDATNALLPKDGDARAIDAGNEFLHHLKTMLPRMEDDDRDIWAVLPDLGRQVAMATYWKEATQAELVKRGLPFQQNPIFQYWASMMHDFSNQFAHLYDELLIRLRERGSAVDSGAGTAAKVISTVVAIVMAML